VLTEDGVPQAIRYCEHQDLAETTKPLLAMTTATEDVTIYDRLARAQIAPETMDNQRYKNRRLLAFYFDMSALPPPTRCAPLKPGKNRAHADDYGGLVAILRYQGGSVDILQDFTADRNGC